MEITNKTILVISQQDWGKMFVSKHHYALELSKLGNKVYFINSPDKTGEVKGGEVSIENTEHDNLFVVKHRFNFPSIIKFKAKPLFALLVKKHIRKIEKAIPSKVDVVWSFDLSNTLPLYSFSNTARKVYMLADMPNEDSVKSARTADAIFSTNFTDEYLEEKFSRYDVPKKFTNHGVAEVFLRSDVTEGENEKIQVGMSGNFLTRFIDWPTLLQIITEHPEVIFNFWGATEVGDANLGHEEGDHLESVKKLKDFDNVVLHGPVTKPVLAEGLKKMDAFLICYDVFKEQSNGTNYHKMLEYLANGKVVITNNVLAYVGTEGLVEMPEDRHNAELPALFSKVISNLKEYNTKESQQLRINYAKNHTYRKNILKIAEYL